MYNLETDEDKIKFLEENKFMTNIELGKEAGVHAKTIRLWKKKFGIKDILKTDSSWFKAYKMPKKPLPKVTDPEIWDNKEWFEENYKEYGIIALSRIIGKSIGFVYRRFDKYGIAPRDHKKASASTNPCCNKRWLEDHYLERKLTVPEIAKLADVNRYTIYNWLAKFGIDIRDRYEANYLGYRKREDKKEGTTQEDNVLPGERSSDNKD